MRNELQRSYVIHTRPYRDTSLLIELLTENHGRMSLLAKGARQSKSRQRQLLQPFAPLAVSWQGKSRLKTLVDVESGGESFSLKSRALYSAMYANELLYYLLLNEDPFSNIFGLYESLLHNLIRYKTLEIPLRIFEFSLLDNLGYGIDFGTDITTESPVEETVYYHFFPDRGFFSENKNPQNKKNLSNWKESSGVKFSGYHLQAIARKDFQSEDVLCTAKKIARLALQAHLQGKKLKSRELFLQSNSKNTSV